MAILTADSGPAGGGLSVDTAPVATASLERPALNIRTLAEMLTTSLQDTRRSCFAGRQALLTDMDYLHDRHKQLLDALRKPDRVLQLPEGKSADPPTSPCMNCWAGRRLYPLAPAARDPRTQIQCSISLTASTQVSIFPIPYIALLCLHCVQAHAGTGALLHQPIYDADRPELHGRWQQHRLEPVC